MFTGIIEQTGIARRVELLDNGSALLDVAAVLTTKLGDSVAVNGCCLTVDRIEGGYLGFSLSLETMERTAFNQIAVGEMVNLERALMLSDRIGGHLVSGHVDTAATVLSIEAQNGFAALKILLPKDVDPLVIEKGSLCLHGVSLTINAIEPAGVDHIAVGFMLVPFTLEHTNFKAVLPGTKLNVELDMVGKYIRKQHCSVSVQ